MNEVDQGAGGGNPASHASSPGGTSAGVAVPSPVVAGSLGAIAAAVADRTARVGDLANPSADNSPPRAPLPSPPVPPGQGLLPPSPPVPPPSVGNVVVVVPEPVRLKRLVAVLRRLGVPVLELAFFPEQERPGFVIREPNEAARAALHATHSLRNTAHPGYPISDACEAAIGRGWEGVRTAEAVGIAAAIVKAGEDHARDSRGRKLRLRWGALDATDMDNLVLVR